MSSASTDLLGYATVGTGPERVIVLHDWMGDHRNYDPMVPYLDRNAFTYALVDLRGYGLSRDRSGDHTLSEATADVLRVASDLGWSRFHVVGHSMSSLVAQQIAASAPEQVISMVLLTPVAPGGMQAPAEVLGFLEQLGLDETKRRAALAGQWGDRLSEAWLDFKVARWNASARPEASKGYVRMFAASAVAGRPRADLPVLAVIGAEDGEPFREPTVREGVGKAYPRFELVVCANAGHYPMQETPVALASVIERFLKRG